MAEVVVVGAGLAGLAVAVRLAKRRHHVTLVERSATIGGAIGRVERDGFTWDSGPASTTLPAVLRDLFRKSGRPIERYVDLRHRPIARRHVFADGSVVDLPTGSRADQVAAVDAGLGEGAGRAWAAYVDHQAPIWDLLRRDVLEVPAGVPIGKAGAHTLRLAESLAGEMTNDLADERLRRMALHPFDLHGVNLAGLSPMAAVHPYVERSFGVWDCAGGMAAIVDALATRLDERGVILRTSATVDHVLVESGRARGVVLADGEAVRADVVVAAIDPRHVVTAMLPRGTRRSVGRALRAAQPVASPAVTHLGLASVPTSLADLPAEVVLHGTRGEPTLVLTTTGAAPEGGAAWTVLTGVADQTSDPLAALANRGLDVRPHLVARIDPAPADDGPEAASVPWGLRWPGWRRYVKRAAASVPIPGLHLTGAGMQPGSGLAYVGWGAANVATAVDAAQSAG